MWLFPSIKIPLDETKPKIGIKISRNAGAGTGLAKFNKTCSEFFDGQPELLLLYHPLHFRRNTLPQRGIVYLLYQLIYGCHITTSTPALWRYALLARFRLKVA